MSWTFYGEALQLARAPFSYEHIPDRTDPKTRWRLRDSRDDAVGHAATETDARAAMDQLNRMRRA